MRNISILIIVAVMLGLGGCKTDRKFEELLNNLQSSDDSIRFNAISDLQNFQSTIDQKIKLLDIAKTDLLPAQYEWQTMPGLIIDYVSKEKDIRILHTIISDFEDYDINAKTASLRYLVLYDSQESMSSYAELAIKYSNNIDYLFTGTLEKKFQYKDTLFPKLLSLIDNEQLYDQVLLLMLEYLNANQLDPQNFKEYISKIIEKSKDNRQIITEQASKGVDIWIDGKYQEARYKGGIIADILGYFDSMEVEEELKQYKALGDNYVIKFAIQSMMRQDMIIDAHLINRLAADPETRNYLYDVLCQFHKEELFPAEFKTQEAFAESDMISWLLYPTELARMPDSIELMKVVDVDSKSEDGMVEFYLFRFKSSYDTWGDYGWMSGVSGYYPKKDKPTTSAHGYTFSSFEKWDNLTPDEHIQEIKNTLSEID